MNIADNLQQVLNELPEGVRLVAVSKFHPNEAIEEAYRSGQRVFGNVEGDIVSTGIVVLRAKSNVKGTISTATMVVEAGAVFNGESNMIASAKGVVRPETTEKK